jgi:tetratricopeptide (TPR) repeat protein
LNQQLPDALTYAQKAVEDEEMLSAKTKLSALTTEELGHMVLLAGYWDTLGWVYFRMDNFDKAEKCLRAAWVLSQRLPPANHLAQVYEKEHKIEAAKEMYRRALGAASQTSYVDIQEIMQRMAKLDSKPIKKNFPALYTAGADLSAMRTTKLPRLVAGEATAEFYVIFAPGSKVEDTKFISGSPQLKTADHALQSAKFDIPFPDDSKARIVRRGILSCYPASGCSFVLFMIDTVKEVN